MTSDLNNQKKEIEMKTISEIKNLGSFEDI